MESVPVEHIDWFQETMMAERKQKKKERNLQRRAEKQAVAESARRAMEALPPLQRTVLQRRDDLRTLWSDLVLARVTAVITNGKTSGTYIRYIDPVSGEAGEWQRELGVKLDPRLRVIATPTVEYYYGFAKPCFCLGAQSAQRAMDHQTIFFESYRACGIDIADKRTGWFEHDATSPLLRVQAPQRGSIVVGTVTMGSKGLYFTQWCIGSPQFLTFFRSVMDHDTAQKRRILTGRTTLDCSGHRGWLSSKPPTSWTADPGQTAALPFNLQVRLDWMRASSQLYEKMCGSEPLDLYYAYQVFCRGEIIDFRGTPADKEQKTRQIMALFDNIARRTMAEQVFL